MPRCVETASRRAAIGPAPGTGFRFPATARRFAVAAFVEKPGKKQRNREAQNRYKGFIHIDTELMNVVD